MIPVQGQKSRTYTKEAEAVIQKWWPEGKDVKTFLKDKDDFMKRMRSLQRDLILVHRPRMSLEDKERASRTLAFLETLI